MARIVEHPFVERVLEDVQPNMSAGVDRIFAAMRDTGELPPRTLESDDDSFEWRVARRTTALLSRIERLHEAHRYVSRLPAPAILKKLDTTQDSWIEYHFTQYLSSFTSINDICLLLCNAVFDLGMPARICSAEAVKGNARVRRTGTPVALRSVERVIQQHRERRNLDIHRGNAPDIGGILGDRTFDMLLIIDTVSGSTGDSVTVRKVAREFRRSSRSLAERMFAELSELKSALRPLLDGLLPVYERNSPLALRRTSGAALGE